MYGCAPQKVNPPVWVQWELDRAIAVDCMGATGVGSDYFDGPGSDLSRGEAYRTKRTR